MGADGPPTDWGQLAHQLEKKATFEAACAAAAAALGAAADPAAAREALALLRRAARLLKARYSRPAFWAAGRELFAAAVGAGLEEEARPFLEECDAFLGGDDGEERAPAAAAAPAFLFQGQLTSEPEPPPAPAGLGLHAIAALLGRAAAAGGDPSAAAAALSEAEAEALQRELDAIAIEIMESTAGGDAAPAPAPASRRALAALPREPLSAARLAALGGPGIARCSICLDALTEGAEVVALPCSHVFHPPCLQPWMERHSNACPQCRHELPLEDAAKEARRLRAAEAAAERRGAEAAVTDDGRMYL